MVLKFFWNPKYHSFQENSRWCQLRAIEWGKLPLFLSQPLAPILLLYITWWKLIISILLLSYLWNLARYKFVSVIFADFTATLVKLKWPTSIGFGVYFFINQLYLLALLSTLWPLISMLLIPLTGPAKFRIIEKIFAHKLELSQRMSGTTKSNFIQRELDGIRLGMDQNMLATDSSWNEIVGAEKKQFLSSLTNEQIFKKNLGDRTLFCGASKGKIYKVALTTSPTIAKKYVDEFATKYGHSENHVKNWLLWEDGSTGLEVSFREIQVNIMLTDKTVFT